MSANQAAKVITPVIFNTVESLPKGNKAFKAVESDFKANSRQNGCFLGRGSEHNK